MRKDGELDYAHVGTDRIYRNKNNLPHCPVLGVGTIIMSHGFQVLRCFTWVVTCSSGQLEVELASEQVDHGLEVAA